MLINDVLRTRIGKKDLEFQYFLHQMQCKHQSINEYIKYLWWNHSSYGGSLQTCPFAIGFSKLPTSESFTSDISCDAGYGSQQGFLCFFSWRGFKKKVIKDIKHSTAANEFISSPFPVLQLSNNDQTSHAQLIIVQVCSTAIFFVLLKLSIVGNSLYLLELTWM